MAIFKQCFFANFCSGTVVKSWQQFIDTQSFSLVLQIQYFAYFGESGPAWVLCCMAVY
jgi:hypothetical protein